MKTILIASLLLLATPALANDSYLLSGPSGSEHDLSRQLSLVDNAYRRCKNFTRDDRQIVWDAAESLAEITGMDWRRIARNAKSRRSSAPDCKEARGIVRNAHGYFSAAE